MKDSRSRKKGFTPLEKDITENNDVQNHPKESSEDKRDSLTGFTLLEVMVAVSIIAILVTLAVPNLINARRRAQASTCVNNLKLLYEAGQLYRLEEGDTGTYVSANTLYKKDYTEKELECPIKGAYADWDVDTHPTCAAGTNGTSYTWDDHVY